MQHSPMGGEGFRRMHVRLSVCVWVYDLKLDIRTPIGRVQFFSHHEQHCNAHTRTIPSTWHSTLTSHCTYSDRTGIIILHLSIEQNSQRSECMSMEHAKTHPKCREHCKRSTNDKLTVWLNNYSLRERVCVFNPILWQWIYPNVKSVYVINSSCELKIISEKSIQLDTMEFRVRYTCRFS